MSMQEVFEQQDNFDSASQVFERAAVNLIQEAYHYSTISVLAQGRTSALPEGFPDMFISTDSAAEAAQPAPMSDRPAPPPAEPETNRLRPGQPAPAPNVEPVPAGQRPGIPDGDGIPSQVRPEPANAQAPPDPPKVERPVDDVLQRRIDEAADLLVRSKGEIPANSREVLESILEGAYLKGGFPRLQRVIDSMNQKLAGSGLRLNYIGLPNRDGGSDLYAYPSSEDGGRFTVFPIGRSGAK